MTTYVRVTRNLAAALALALGLGTGWPGWAAPLGTGFTFQGQLKQNGTPAPSGIYQMTFDLYDGPDPLTAALLGTFDPAGVQVTDGLFSPTLNFGSGPFDGSALWLRITVEGTPLSPLQPITAGPYALFGLDGAGSGSSPWEVNGSEIYYAAGNVGIGINDPNAPLEVLGFMRVTRATDLEQHVQLRSETSTGHFLSGRSRIGNKKNMFIENVHTGTDAPAGETLIAFRVGSSATPTEAMRIKESGNVGVGTTSPGEKLTVNGVIHSLSGGVRFPDGTVQATAAGGGGSTLWAANGSNIYYNAGNVGIGTATPGQRLHVGGNLKVDGWIGTDEPQPLKMHVNNEQAARFEHATMDIGNGFEYRGIEMIFGHNANLVSGPGSVIGGGGEIELWLNGSSSQIAGAPNQISGIHSTIGGGTDNEIAGRSSIVGGGSGNSITGDYATVGGGSGNSITGDYATVGGGSGNSITGDYATVGGGSGNRAAGARSCVPGGSANEAVGDYSFAAGQRAHALHDGCFVLADDSISSDLNSIIANELVVRAAGGTRIYSNASLTTGVRLFPGLGSWASVSDRNAKQEFVPVQGRDVLERLAGLPISTWRYKAEEGGVRHMGPMAQDFHAAFGLGSDDKHIVTVDADGVALAAIQGLHELVLEKDAQIETLTRRVSAQEGLLADLLARVEALESTQDHGIPCR